MHNWCLLFHHFVIILVCHVQYISALGDVKAMFRINVQRDLRFITHVRLHPCTNSTRPLIIHSYLGFGLQLIVIFTSIQPSTGCSRSDQPRMHQAETQERKNLFRWFLLSSRHLVCPMTFDSSLHFQIGRWLSYWQFYVFTVIWFGGSEPLMHYHSQTFWG